MSTNTTVSHASQSPYIKNTVLERVGDIVRAATLKKLQAKKPSPRLRTFVQAEFLAWKAKLESAGSEPACPEAGRLNQLLIAGVREKLEELWHVKLELVGQLQQFKEQESSPDSTD